jgi:hypothetical protein
MGYAIVMSPCFGCGRPFAYNPHRVPSVTVNGRREPICQHCLTIVNPRRRANGLPEIVPLPDAYEPIDEHEL